jgi:NAD-dependent DNA ligase
VKGVLAYHGLVNVYVGFTERLYNIAEVNADAVKRKQDWLDGKAPAHVLVTTATTNTNTAYVAHFCYETRKAELHGIEWVTMSDRMLVPILQVSPTSFHDGDVNEVVSNGFGYNGVTLTRGAELTLERFAYMQPTVVACRTEEGADSLPLPNRCQACRGQPLRSTKKGLECTNRTCTATLLKQIRLFLEATHTVGLTDVHLRQLIEEGKVSDLTELYCLDVEDYAALFGGNQAAGQEVMMNLTSTLPNNAEDMFAAVLGSKCTDTHVVSFSTLLEEQGYRVDRATCEEHFQQDGITDVSAAYDMWQDTARLVSELMSLVQSGG